MGGRGERRVANVHQGPGCGHRPGNRSSWDPNSGGGWPLHRGSHGQLVQLERVMAEKGRGGRQQGVPKDGICGKMRGSVPEGSAQALRQREHRGTRRQPGGWSPVDIVADTDRGYGAW